jgi:hypothetical protein
MEAREPVPARFRQGVIVVGKSSWVGLFLLAVWSACVGGPGRASAQERPLQTDTAELLPVGKVRSQLGFEFLQRQRYSLSGFEGDLTRVGVMSLHVGVGEYAEFQLSGVAQDFLSITRRNPAVIPTTVSGDTTNDTGDLVLAAKLKLAAEKAGRPALAFKVAVQLPNASNERGLGNDETEFYASLLASKRVGKVRLTANAGLAILGSPVVPNSQSDMLLYGLAAAVPVGRRLELVAEAYGREGTQRVGNERRGQVRVGARIHAGGLYWDLAGLAGLHRFDADSGVAFGVRYEIQAFHKSRAPRTVK